MKIMAKKKPKSKLPRYEKEILQVIKKNRLFVINDIFAYYKGCCSSTFYNNEMEKLETIKTALEDNKVLTRQSLKNKWFNSDNATLQIALFKTICSEDEAHRLNGSRTENRNINDNRFSTNPMEELKEIFGLNEEDKKTK